MSLILATLYPSGPTSGCILSFWQAILKSLYLISPLQYKKGWWCKLTGIQKEFFGFLLLVTFFAVYIGFRVRFLRFWTKKGANFDFKAQEVTVDTCWQFFNHYYIDFICKKKIFCYNNIVALCGPHGEIAGQSWPVNHKNSPILEQIAILIR